MNEGTDITVVPIPSLEEAIALSREPLTEERCFAAYHSGASLGRSGKQDVMAMLAGLSASFPSSYEFLERDSMPDIDMSRHFREGKPNPTPSEHKRAELRKKRKAKKRNK